MADDARDAEHRRPDGVTDATVEALGRLSAAMDHVEEARGHVYALHRRFGSIERTLEEAHALLLEAGHDDLAAQLDREVLGANALPGYWTFQLVEAFDDGFYATARGFENKALDELIEGKRHVFEAEMKELRRSRGVPGHEARP